MDLRRVRAGVRVTRAALFDAMRVAGAPHIGVLLDNVPDFAMWLGAASVLGGTIVGINPTRRGAGLERDILHTECQVIVTERRHERLLDGLDLGTARGRVLVVDDPSYAASLASLRRRTASHPSPWEPSDQVLLLFTSGTTGTPKAVVCSKAVSTGSRPRWPGRSHSSRAT